MTTGKPVTSSVFYVLLAMADEPRHGLGIAEDARVRFYSQVVDRIEGFAGISAATFALNAPLETTDWQAGILIEDPTASWTEGADTGTLLPGYFNVMRIPVLEGRDFTDADDGTFQPVAIVNRSFADRAWPGMSAIGRRVRLSAAIEGEEPWRSVIGVVGNVRQNALDTEPEPMIWVPFAQDPWSRSLNLLARTGPDRAAAASAIREALAELDPSMPPPNVTSMEARVRIHCAPTDRARLGRRSDIRSGPGTDHASSSCFVRRSRA
jgi:putative ABC transport system permease protein